MSEYTADKVYEEAYKNSPKWDKWLPKDVYDYHHLMMKEVNAPVDLQMGVLLPFISSLCGPKTRTLYLPTESVLNIFWINIAASGVGKTVCRKRFISASLDYILKNFPGKISDFEVSKFTRAGIEDKIKSTNGYCYMVTDEGTGFFDDLKKKESKHESDLSLLNQFYDGEGDKTTLAQNKERVVPPNSTCISISLQQEAFIHALNNLGRSLWLDSGFGERFLVSAIRPYRHSLKENKKAAKVRKEKYQANLVEKVCFEIFKFHHGQERLYELDTEADELYETIFDKYNGQFNLKYSGTGETLSQEPLDDTSRAEIAVRTKAPELIGRLTSVLWIYSQAFQSVLKGGDFNIPLLITQDFVKYTEEIVNLSYTHSEIFSSAVLAKTSSLNCSINKPAPSHRTRVVHAMIRFSGPVVNIRALKQGIKPMSTDMVRDELKKLEEEGIGWVITRDRMQQDRILPFNQCSSVYLKPEPVFLDKKLFDYVTEPGVDAQLYETYFKGDLSENYKIICKKYHPHRQTVSPTPSNTATSQYSEVPLECRVKKIPKAQRPRNALTVMLEEEAARQTERKMKLKEQDEQKSEEDVLDTTLDTTLELQDLATGSETTSKRDDETVSPEKTRTNSPSELSKVERAKVFTGSTKHVNFDSPGEKNKSGEKKGPDFHNSQTAGRSRPLQLSDILDSDEISQADAGEDSEPKEEKSHVIKRRKYKKGSAGKKFLMVPLNDIAQAADSCGDSSDGQDKGPKKGYVSKMKPLADSEDTDTDTAVARALAERDGNDGGELEVIDLDPKRKTQRYHRVIPKPTTEEPRGTRKSKRLEDLKQCEHSASCKKCCHKGKENTRNEESSGPDIISPTRRAPPKKRSRQTSGQPARGRGRGRGRGSQKK